MISVRPVKTRNPPPGRPLPRKTRPDRSRFPPVPQDLGRFATKGWCPPLKGGPVPGPLLFAGVRLVLTGNDEVAVAEAEGCHRHGIAGI